MSHLQLVAPTVRKRPTGDVNVIVSHSGLYWSVTGELASLSTASFIAHDIRLLAKDNSESENMFDLLNLGFVEELEGLAVESLQDERRFC